MLIGVPREQANDEKRVGLSPAAVHTLALRGHQILVERGAGEGSGFDDEHYDTAGARLASSAEEVYQRAELLVKINALNETDIDCLGDSKLIMGFMHLPTRDVDLVRKLSEKKATVLDYSTIQDAGGVLPILAPMSQIAGRMVPQIAGRYLQSDHGGSGILLGGLPGVPPAEVVILGGGTVGRNATRAFLSTGARVTLLDDDLEHLRELHWLFDGRVTTYKSNIFNLPKVMKFADVVVGAVRGPGGLAPRLVSRDMVASLRKGSVIIDLSIDQGGCFETSRPTRLGDPVYTLDGVTHYCAPNMPSLVARTATYALVNAILPLVEKIADDGIDCALGEDVSLFNGASIHRGNITDERVASVLGLPMTDLKSLLETGGD
jgi:alanine dehydrogenase